MQAKNLQPERRKDSLVCRLVQGISRCICIVRVMHVSRRRKILQKKSSLISMHHFSSSIYLRRNINSLCHSHKSGASVSTPFHGLILIFFRFYLHKMKTENSFSSIFLWPQKSAQESNAGWILVNKRWNFSASFSSLMLSLWLIAQHSLIQTSSPSQGSACLPLRQDLFMIFHPCMNNLSEDEPLLTDF